MLDRINNITNKNYDITDINRNLFLDFSFASSLLKNTNDKVIDDYLKYIVCIKDNEELNSIISNILNEQLLKDKLSQTEYKVLLKNDKDVKFYDHLSTTNHKKFLSNVSGLHDLLIGIGYELEYNGDLMFDYEFKYVNYVFPSIFIKVNYFSEKAQYQFSYLFNYSPNIDIELNSNLDIYGVIIKDFLDFINHLVILYSNDFINDGNLVVNLKKLIRTIKLKQILLKNV